MSRNDHVAAIFADRCSAEDALADLEVAGLGSERLGVALRSGEHVVFERNADREFFLDVGAGAAVGTPIGLLGGITLSLAIIPGLAVGGILGVSLAGAAWGAIFGGLIGADVGDVEWTQHENLAFEHLGADEVLVVVKAHEHEQLCRQIFTRHDGRLLTDGSRLD